MSTDAGHLRFPLVQSGGPLRRWLRHQLGALLGWLSPARTRQLRAGSPDTPLRPSDYWRLAALLAERARDGASPSLSPIHRLFWRSDAAAGFQQREAGWRYQRFAQQFAPRLLPVLRAAMQASGCRRLIEIGPGTGEVLDHLARSFDHCEVLIGVEVNPALVAVHAARGPDPRIQLHHGDGLELARQHGGPGTAYFSHGGVLEYFDRDTLRAWFAWVAGHSAPAVVALIEPIAPGQDPERDQGSPTFGVEHSYSHAYAALAREAGLQIEFLAVERWRESPWLLMVARCGGPA